MPPYRVLDIGSLAISSEVTEGYSKAKSDCLTKRSDPSSGRSYKCCSVDCGYGFNRVGIVTLLIAKSAVD